MSAIHAVVLLAMLIGTLTPAPDLHYALGSLIWSALGFLAGVGAGYLLWGRKDRP